MSYICFLGAHTVLIGFVELPFNFWNAIGFGPIWVCRKVIPLGHQTSSGSLLLAYFLERRKVTGLQHDYMREDNIRFKYQAEELKLSLNLPIILCSIYTDYIIVALTLMCLIPILPMLFFYLKILSSVSFAYQNLVSF